MCRPGKISRVGMLIGASTVRGVVSLLSTVNSLDTRTQGEGSMLVVYSVRAEPTGATAAGLGASCQEKEHFSS